MDDLVIPSRDTNGSLFDPQQNLEPRTPTIEPEQISTKRAPEMWQMTFNTSQMERSPWMPTILSFYNGRRHHRLPDPLRKHAATREVADPIDWRHTQPLPQRARTTERHVRTTRGYKFKHSKARATSGQGRGKQYFHHSEDHKQHHELRQEL
jgi:hypothetical protein